MKLFYKNNKVWGLIAICFAILLSFQMVSVTTLNDSTNMNTNENPKTSAQISGIEYDWLNNSGFDSDKYWESKILTDGSNPDVNAIISNGLAHFEVIGDTYTFSLINGTPSTAKGWRKSQNSQYPAEPNQAAELRTGGAYARHRWSETEDQQVIAQWDKTIDTGRNMSDYVVTAASLNMTINATVHSNPGYTPYPNPWGGLDVSADESEGDSQFNVGDFIRYFIAFSDKDKNKIYPDVISYQTSGLGADHGTGNQYDYLYDTVIEVDDVNDLIFILNNLFQNYNDQYLNITIGMFLNCEDNWISDDDFFEDIYINSVNLSFTYKKKIESFNSVSWNQDANTFKEKLSDLIPNNESKVIATRANLKFQYSINKNWSIYTNSINSELNFYLNGNPYPIPIKLININTTSFEEISIELTPPIDYVNFSIEVLIKDDFNLDRIITISIDNVTLDISYIIYFDLPPSDGGGGGGRTIIRGEDYTPIVISLVAGIIGLVIVFGAYQKRYKYPPIVRKIRKLKKKIRKGKKTKPVLLNKREELIKTNFKKLTDQVLESEIIKSEILAKQTITKGGN